MRDYAGVATAVMFGIFLIVAMIPGSFYNALKSYSCHENGGRWVEEWDRGDGILSADRLNARCEMD